MLYNYEFLMTHAIVPYISGHVQLKAELGSLLLSTIYASKWWAALFSLA